MSTVSFLERAQISFAFEAVKERVEGSSAQPVAVPPEFLDDSQPENRLLRRVVENVEADKSGIDCIGCGHQLSYLDIEVR